MREFFRHGASLREAGFAEAVYQMFTTGLIIGFKLCQSASKKWRRLDISHQLAEFVRGVKFKDGEKPIERAA